TTEGMIQRVHLVNMMEIHAGQLAKQRAQSQQVKDFADRISRDHQQADQRVKQIAQQKGITLDDSMMGMGGMSSTDSSMHGGSSSTGSSSSTSVGSGTASGRSQGRDTTGAGRDSS